MKKIPLLSIREYHQIFPIGKLHHIHALHNINLDIYPGEIFGLVGESGCGKSTLAKAVMGIHKPSKGEIFYKNQCISKSRIEKELKKTIQRSLQIIFQDSSVSLNPRMNIEDCMAEPFIIHKLFPNKKERQKKIAELLESVGMDSSFLQKIPAELSGGHKQRVCIARSLALEPELIIADEPVSSLDVSVQAQIINLFMKLRKEKNFSLLFIAHDLSMVQYLCDRVGVLYAGKLVEVAPADELFNSPMHPYTKMLLSAIPQPDPITEKNKTFTPQTNFLIPNHAKLKEISPDHFVLEE